ncbi:MAG: OsmC family protein [Candidatus Margulisiibacteriota bacterium]
MEIIFPGGKKVAALYKGFRIKTDQSERHGGEASEPSPFDMFLASLGTCTGIYVLNFCQERNIPTDKIKLFLKTVKDAEGKKISKISIEIQVPPDFPEKYRATIVKVAGLCSVKKMMQRPPEFEIFIK